MKQGEETWKGGSVQVGFRTWSDKGMSGRYRAGGTECVGVGKCKWKWKGHLLNGRGTNGHAQNFLHQENCMSITEAEDNWGHLECWLRKSFPRGEGQTGRQQLIGSHCHSFISPVTRAVRSVYRTAEHQGLLQVITSQSQPSWCSVLWQGCRHRSP